MGSAVGGMARLLRALRLDRVLRTHRRGRRPGSPRPQRRRSTNLRPVAKDGVPPRDPSGGDGHHVRGALAAAAGVQGRHGRRRRLVRGRPEQGRVRRRQGMAEVGALRVRRRVRVHRRRRRRVQRRRIRVGVRAKPHPRYDDDGGGGGDAPGTGRVGEWWWGRRRVWQVDQRGGRGDDGGCAASRRAGSGVGAERGAAIGGRPGNHRRRLTPDRRRRRPGNEAAVAAGGDVRVRPGIGRGGVPGVPHGVADEVAPDAGRRGVLLRCLRGGAPQRQGFPPAGVPWDGAGIQLREDAEFTDADDHTRDVEQRCARGHSGPDGDGAGHTGTVNVTKVPLSETKGRPRSTS
mmetsp:Transcript_6042/g.26703  ORF Transcript_6042/g.26703 Transcript_6042/m.26703 type:complete len:347 (+) Transcript_6042:416-1456(+)